MVPMLDFAQTSGRSTSVPSSFSSHYDHGGSTAEKKYDRDSYTSDYRRIVRILLYDKESLIFRHLQTFKQKIFTCNNWGAV